ncbi:MAG: choice-of-anchor J domain-containing protein [Paludibacteraceae bacterium]|nr:choice-of-anchor J domain-containing protein [Paludibacteraceae bacterium]
MSKKLLFSALCLMMAFCVNMTAQTTLISEDFEQGLPATWTQDPSTGVTAWTVSNSGLTGVTAYGGSNYASLYTTTQQVNTKLILPLTDISSLTNPEFSFYLVQQARGVNTGYARDTLKVYARTSTTAAWTLIETIEGPYTIWERQAIDLSTVASTNVQIALEYAYGSGLGLGIDNVRLGDASVCTTPNNLQAYRITSNSAELMWNAYEGAYQYALKVSTTAMADPATATADIFDQAVFFKPYQVTGLTPSTNYYFYVSATCGVGDESPWSAAGTFTTACAPQTLPYTDGFETGSSFTNCWTKNFEANGDWGTTTPSATTYGPLLSTTAKHAGTYSVRLYAYYSNSTSYSSPRTIKSYVASHEMNTTNIGNQQLTFWLYGSTANSKVHVGVIADPTDFSTFEEVATVQVGASATWEEIVLPLDGVTNTAANHICFMADGMDGTALNYVYIDDITVEDKPLCPKAAIVQAKNVYHDRATLDWVGTASAWQVKVSTTPLTDPTTDAALIDTTVSGHPMALRGLSVRTAYYVYVRANCTADGNGYGAWSQPVNFTTTSIAALPPYTCDFEDPAENAQWELNNGAAINKWFIGNGTNHGGSNALYISNDNGVSNAYTIASAPGYAYAYRTILLPPGSHGISFDWLCNGESTIDYLRAELFPTNVAVPQGFSGTTTQGANQTATPGAILLNNYKLNLASTWQHYDALVTVTDTTTYNLAFFWRNDNSIGNQPPAALDNIQINTYTCTTPQQIFVANIGVNSADLTWNPGSETAWEVEISDATSVVLDTIVSTPALTLNNFVANTAYTVRLRGYCSSTDIGWWVSNTFRTQCDDIHVLPYVEDFQSYGTGTGSFNPCWTVAKRYSSYPYVPTTAYNHTPNSGTTGALYVYAYNTTSNMFAFPRLNVPGKTVNDMLLSFYALKTSTTAYNITVGVMTDPTDETTFTPVQTVAPTASSTTANQNWDYFEVDFSSYTGNGEYIAFYDGTRGATNSIYLDDIRLEALPTCMRPRNIQLVDITENSASLTYDTLGAASGFEAIAVGSGLDILPANIAATATSTTTDVTFTGLTPTTLYDFYIRQICAPGDTSDWSVALTARTTPAPTPMPYTTDFADATDNAGWVLENGGATNRWCIGGNVVGNGDTKSLYISNNNGASHEYTGSSSSYVYAYRSFHFTPGIYSISFDWLCNGYSTYNLMRAYLVPTTVQLAGGNAMGMTSTTNTDPAGWISLSGKDAAGKLNLQTSWQTLQYELVVSDTVNYNLVFFWKNSTSSGSNPPGTVDNLSVIPLTCAVIVHHDVYDTYNVMTLEASQGTATAYEVVVDDQPINLTNIGNVDHHVTINNTVDSITGLTPNTQYYAYVRTICTGNDTGRWTVADFKTECTIINQFPYTWDLEDATATGSNTTPNCWTRLNTYTYPYVYSGRSYNGGSKCLYFYTSSTSTALPNFMAMPKIDVPAIQDYRIDFNIYYSSTTVSYGLIVGVMEDLNDASTFEPVDTVWTQMTADWEPVSVRFRNYTGNGKYIVFRADYGIRGNYNYIYADYFTITEDRYCSTIDNLSVTNLTGNGAQLNWATQNSLTYNLLVTTAEVNPDTIDGTEPVVFMYEEDLTDNYLDLTGYLSTNTTYWFYVQGDCQSPDGRPSLWSEGYQFTTVCNANTLPYAENFVVRNPGEGVMPPCWQTILETAGNPTGTYVKHPHIYKGTNTYLPNPTDSCDLLMSCYYSATASSKSIAIMPEFAGSLAGYKMNFRVACTLSKSGVVGGTLLIGTVTDVSDGSTFVPFDTIATDNYWNLYEVNLSNVPTTTGTRIAFVFDGDLNQGSGNIYIDNLTVVPSAACSAPANIRFSNLIGGDIDIYANTVNNADTLVQMFVVTADSTVVRDTIINIANMPWHVTGLNGMTTYKVAARVVCNAADSTFSPFYYRYVAFTTGCTAINLPYSYGFDDSQGSGTSYKPTCWTCVQGSGGTSYPYNSSTYHSSGNYSLYMYGLSTNATYGVLPELNVASVNNLVLTFKSRVTTSTYAMTIGVMSDPDDVTTFDSITTVLNTSTTAFQEHTVRFNNYTGTGKYLAFRTGGTGTASYVYVDDVYVEAEPTCHRPTAPVFVSNTTTSITASWTAGVDNETSWDVVVLPQGQTPDYNTAPMATVTTPQATITNLLPNAAYVISVRAVCSATDHSNWLGTTMRTSCTSVAVNDSASFEEHFDSDGTGTGVHPSCWVTGTNYTTAYPNISSTYKYDGVGALYFYATTSYYSYAATPEIDGDIKSLQVTFQGRATSLAYRLKVGVMTNPNDITTFTEIGEIAPTATNTWEESTIKFSSYNGTGKYIAFLDPQGAASYYYIDNVVVSTTGACAAPSVQITELSRDSLQLNLIPTHDVDSLWQIVVTPASSSATPDTTAALINQIVNFTSYTFTGFPYNTEYTLYVRTVCGNAETEWAAIRVTTPCGPYTIDTAHSLTEDFDSYGTGTGAKPNCWTCVSTYNASYPYVSSTQKYNGAGSLYLYSSTTGYTYAASPELVGTPVQGMKMTFYGYTASTSYILRVGVMDDPDDITTFTEVTSVQASTASSWYSVTVDFGTYAGTGKYIAFKTTDGSTTSWYIDNVSIIAKPACSAPSVNLTINSYDNVVATLIPATAQDSVFEYVLTTGNNSGVPLSSQAIARDTVDLSNLTATFTTLLSNSTYSLYVRALCGTVWGKHDFTTPCSAVTVNDSISFTENFDNDGTGNGKHPSCWTCNTNYTTSTSGYPFISGTYKQSGVGALYFYGSTSYYSYAATPQIVGTPANQLRVTLSARKTNAAYTIELGVMTDPEDVNTFVPLHTISPVATSTWETFTYDLSSYTGNGQYVALRAPMGTANYMYVDDILIQPIPACSAPGINATFNHGNIELQLSPLNPSQTQFEVVVNQSATPDTVNAIFHQVVNSTSVSFPAPYLSTLSIFVRTNCTSEWSDWGRVTLTTPCGVVGLPYTENFTVYPPTCWDRYSGLLNDVIAGNTALTTTTSGWLANSTYCWTDPHARINIYGTTVKYWLVSPEMYIDTTAILSFDLALTDYANSNPIENFTAQQDDRFVVIASRDGGNTWSATDIIAEWNNTGSSLVYNQISTTGEHVELPLRQFIGDTIRIALYGESTATGGDNDLHVDNFGVSVIRNVVDYTENTCDGYLYVGHGFNLSADDIDLATSPNLFTRVDGDTLIRLTLNVMPSSEIVINDTVCASALPYTLNDFNVTTAGTYNRYLTSALGCDSIVTLNLVVNQGFTDSETVTICASALPYLWNGQSLTAAGTYTHTVAAPNGCDSVFTLNLVVTQAITSSVSDAICQGQTYTWNGQSYSTAGDYTWTGTALNGCDSIVTLHLTVNPVHYESIQLTIEQEETPYEWNGFSIDTTGSYTWYGQTAAGCDSVVTLDLYVRCVGLDYAEDGMFAISPNPVHRGGNVRLDVSLNEAERDGMVVEVFTSNGKLVNRFEPKEQPMFIKMPDIDGLYMVRLTTGTGRVLYGKVIVK